MNIKYRKIKSCIHWEGSLQLRSEGPPRLRMVHGWPQQHGAYEQMGLWSSRLSSTRSLKLIRNEIGHSYKFKRYPGGRKIYESFRFEPRWICERPVHFLQKFEPDVTFRQKTRLAVVWFTKLWLCRKKSESPVIDKTFGESKFEWSVPSLQGTYQRSVNPLRRKRSMTFSST